MAANPHYFTRAVQVRLHISAVFMILRIQAPWGGSTGVNVVHPETPLQILSTYLRDNLPIALKREPAIIAPLDILRAINYRTEADIQICLATWAGERLNTD